MIKRTIITIFICSALCQALSAQDAASSNSQSPLSRTFSDSKLLLSGFAYCTFSFNNQMISFSDLSLDEMLLISVTKNILVVGEVGYDTTTSVSPGLVYISFLANDYLNITVGNFPSALGTFGPHLDAPWINRFPSLPFGYDDQKGWAPNSVIGLGINGAFHLGDMKINYGLFADNGPKLVADTNSATSQGTLDFGGGIADNNRNKEIGGRIGFIPFLDSSLEVGAGAAISIVGDENDATYKNVGAQMYSFDFSFVKPIDGLGGVFDLKAQVNLINVDKANYFSGANAIPSFDNKSMGYYATLYYRPSMVKNKIIRNFEVALRYDGYSLAPDAPWAEAKSQYDIGLDYWVSWRTVIKFAYEHNMDGTGKYTDETYLVQVATGF